MPPVPEPLITDEEAHLFADAYTTGSPHAIREMTPDQRERYSRLLDTIFDRIELKRVLTAAAFEPVPEAISPGSCVTALKDAAIKRRLAELQREIEKVKDGDGIDDLLRAKLAAARKRRDL